MGSGDERQPGSELGGPESSPTLEIILNPQAKRSVSRSDSWTFIYQNYRSESRTTNTIALMNPKVGCVFCVNLKSESYVAKILLALVHIQEICPFIICTVSGSWNQGWNSPVVKV